MQTVQVAILDSNDLSRFGLQAMVERLAANVHVAGAFARFEELVVLLQREQVDVLLLDDVLPGMLDISQVLNRVFMLQPDVRVIVLSSTLMVNNIQRLLAQSVSGFIYKEESLTSILNAALQLVVCDQLYLSPQAAMLPYKSVQPLPDPTLNTRDSSVLQLMSKGKSVQEMAALLNTNDKKIYYSQEKLRQVLGVKTTELIVAAAIRRGWIGDVAAKG